MSFTPCKRIESVYGGNIDVLFRIWLVQKWKISKTKSIIISIYVNRYIIAKNICRKSRKITLNSKSEWRDELNCWMILNFANIFVQWKWMHFMDKYVFLHKIVGYISLVACICVLLIKEFLQWTPFRIMSSNGFECAVYLTYSLFFIMINWFIWMIIVLMSVNMHSHVPIIIIS